ncbi:MAG: HIT family protein [Chloroflexales bacterium]|nr:HIT family protein [Chloroflexales bacterium]
MATIFTRIINGEIPAFKIFEDADTLAFLDIAPASPGHTLVICKNEVATLTELSDAQLLATARTTQRVATAIQQALQTDGINIIQNNGTAAGQEVFHYHVHIIPRWNNDGVIRFWQQTAMSQAAFTEIVSKIRLMM